MGIGDYYNQVASNLTEEEVLRQHHNLHLERVPNTNVAVYQTHATADTRTDIDTMKAEMLELRQLVDQRFGTVAIDESGRVQQQCLVGKQYSCRLCK